VFADWIDCGPLHLPTFATLLSLGLIGGVCISLWQARRRKFSLIWTFDAALVAASGGLVGARLTYVAIHWTYYQDHWSEALHLGAGGLAWQGGLVLGILGVVLYARRAKVPLDTLLDVLAWGLAWFVLFIWLGSGAANDIYGRETWPGEGLWWTLSADLPDLYGLRAPRVNVPLLGAVWSGLVLIGLALSSWRWREQGGGLFLSCIGLTGLGGLLLVPLQANPVPFLFHVRLDWWFNLALLIIGLGGCAFVNLGRRDLNLVSRSTS
jgi:prolipoprotein diacylglyceryltransferase